MRLRHIEKADFRKSELTNFQAFIKANKEAAEKLGRNDVVLFVSQGGEQLVFVHGFHEMEVPRGKAKRAVKVLASRRFRVQGSTWNPLMLVDYASQAGLELEGLKRFEDYYRELA